MKSIRILILACLMACLPVGLALSPIGCSTSAQRITYNTLASVGATANSAYSAYLDLVVKGSVKTNDVPKVSAAYNTFEMAFAAAISAAQFNPTNPAPANVTDLANNLLSAISAAKGK